MSLSGDSIFVLTIVVSYRRSLVHFRAMPCFTIWVMSAAMFIDFWQASCRS